MGFRMNSDYFLNNIYQLIFAMEKRCVFFEVRTEFLNKYLDDLRASEGQNRN
jgi:hypothetical protein